jgi:hypothetical protein
MRVLQKKRYILLTVFISQLLSSRTSKTSVADRGFLSRIPDPKTATKKRDLKSSSTFFCSHENHKIENYINFDLAKKTIWADLRRIIELSTQKIVIKLSQILVWDPGSGKNLFRIPDPGVKKGTGSRIRSTD